MPFPDPGEQVCDLTGLLGAVGDPRLGEVDRLVRQPPDVPQLEPQDIAEVVARAEIAVDADPVHVPVTRVPPARWPGDLAGPEVAVLVAGIPGPDHICHVLGREDVKEMTPRSFESIGRRTWQPPWIPPAVHFVAQGQHHMARERLNLPGVGPDRAVIGSSRNLGHADPRRVELDQRQLMHSYDLKRLAALERSGEAVVELDKTQMRA